MRRYVVPFERKARLYVSTDSHEPPTNVFDGAPKLTLPVEARFFLWQTRPTPTKDIAYPAVTHLYPGYHGSYSTRVNPTAPLGSTVVLGAFKPGTIVDVQSPEGVYRAECETVIPFNEVGVIVASGKILVTLVRPLNEGEGTAGAPVSRPLAPRNVLAEVLGGCDTSIRGTLRGMRAAVALTRTRILVAA